MFLGLMGFCSQVSALWGKRGSTGLKLRPTVTQKRKLREVMRKRGKVPLYPYFHPPILNMIGAFCIELGVLEVTGFWSIEEALNPRFQSKRLWSDLL